MTSVAVVPPYLPVLKSRPLLRLKWPCAAVVDEPKSAAVIDPALIKDQLRHSGLDPESSNPNIGALCAPLDTGLRRYDALHYSRQIDGNHTCETT